MSDYDSNHFDDEIEEWELEWAKKAIAPYLDDDGNIDIDKLNAACEPLDKAMKKEFDSASISPNA